MGFETEDNVRDKARKFLGFCDDASVAQSGVGQTTTFKTLLGIKGQDNKRKPDGWYLPKDKGAVAIILEAKNSNEDIGKGKGVDEIKRNCRIVMDAGYKHVVGLIYNGKKTIAFKNNFPTDVPSELQSKEYYFKIFTERGIDKERIYGLTKHINDCLRSKFRMNDLYQRMIFTACALVAERYGAKLGESKNYKSFKQSVHDTLEKQLKFEGINKNNKIETLLDVFSGIDPNSTDDQETIGDFVEWVGEISEHIDSNKWRGEDVMSIFFDEFYRYGGKRDFGQVFTPDHITSFMYHLIDINKNDRVGD